MLHELRVENLLLIEHAELRLGSGLNVLTGETGAGKTMLLSALGLLLGGRADAGLVRARAPRAVVEGRLVVPADGPVASLAREAGAELDDGTLLVARTVSADGRSRAHLGGRSVPVALVAELAGDLVAVHGQADQQLLLRPGRQRAALDRYAGAAVGEPLAAYAETHHRHRTVQATLAELRERARERAREADLLRLGLAEVAAAAPQPGEDLALDCDVRRLAHADALRTAAATAHAALLGDPADPTPSADAGTLVGVARRALDSARDHDPALAALADRLREVGYLLADAATELASYAAAVDADPARLAAAQERQAALGRLRRRYGDTVDDVLAWAARAEARLGELGDDEDRISGLKREAEQLQARLADLASRLSAARTAAADRFAAAVSTELAGLAMPHARISAAVSSRPGAYGPTGVDEVELLLVPHRGAIPRALGKGASGGELSRVMLAVEVVFAGADPVPTFVFDEVDAGVGGRAAVEVGTRLARLARTAQVLVVTHLPQVAAFADRHLLVTKTDDGRVTRAGVRRLDERARVRELSRMLAGLEDSALARGHVEELLATAAAAKSPRSR
jgi:DNA repair protein RecN (Recombination protein N)